MWAGKSIWESTLVEEPHGSEHGILALEIIEGSGLLVYENLQLAGGSNLLSRRLERQIAEMALGIQIRRRRHRLHYTVGLQLERNLIQNRCSELK